MLETRIPEDLWTVSADPTQIHQVLLNLCLNARDAMAAGGTLSLAAENVVFDEHYAAMNPEAEAGPYVILEVVDTGVGIPADNLEKIFDPFFTTKEPGVGTGLGLSTVHGIVKGHGGFVQVRSQVGEGTLFKVYLPAIPAVVEVSEIPPGEEIPTGSGETILVVDDEEVIVRLARRVLERAGHRVVTAADGAEALERFGPRGDGIDLVLLDRTLPRLHGEQVLERLRSLRPGVKVVVCTGDGSVGAERFPGAAAILHKPYLPAELVAVIRQVLDGRAPGG